jgi:hypothetical protein
MASATSLRVSTLPASQRIEKLIEAISKLPPESYAVARVCSEFVEGLKLDYTLNTTALALTKARRAIAKKLGGETHPAYALLLSGPAAARLGQVSVGLTALEVDVRKQNDRRRVNGYRRKQIAVTEDDALTMVKQARAMMNTNLVFDSTRHRSHGKRRWDIILCGLLLITGRRPFELTYLGGMETVSKKPRLVLFSGQAKTRDAATAQTAPYEIPVLAPASEIIRGLNRLREAFPLHEGKLARENAADAIHDLYKTDLGATVRAYYPTWKARDLRALYGIISYHAYAPPEMAHAVWLSEVLGHSNLADSADGDIRYARKADTLTSAYYERFYIPTLSRSTRLRLP